MRMKRITIIIILLSLFIVVGLWKGLSESQRTVTLNTSNKNTSVSNWNEIQIKEGASLAKCSSVNNFDLKEIIMNTDYVFRGTVVSRKEYEVEWIDDKGEQWGPFPSSVIEVKVTKEYYGKSPVKGDFIRIYYPYSLSTIFEGSFLIKDKGEYVFITQALDEEFVERRKKETPDDKFEQEKYADVYISHPCYSLMPIDNETVFMYNDYFMWDKEVVKQVITDKSVKTDKMSSSKLIEKGWFIALNETDFNNAFLKLFKNPNELPDASEIKEMNATQNSKNTE